MSLDEPSRARILSRPGPTLVVALALAVRGASGSAAAEALGAFDDHGDVGSPRLAGSAVYNGFSQEYTLSAAGVNLWGARDEFHFVWKRLRGDFVLQARVELVGKGVDPHRKLGVMVRSALDAESPYADAVVHGDGLTSLQFRRAKGATTEEIRSALTGADVLQLERRGDRVTLRAARFGDPLATSELDAGPYAASPTPTAARDTKSCPKLRARPEKKVNALQIATPPEITARRERRSLSTPAGRAASEKTMM